MVRLMPKAVVGLTWLDQFGTKHHAIVRLETGPPQ
jgi:hypothetical protein